MTFSLFENRALAQKAWNFMNDSLRTNIFQRFSPNVIAASIIFLSTRVMNISLPEDNEIRWWDVFEADYAALHKCAKAILHLYQLPRVSWAALDEALNRAKQLVTQRLLQNKQNNAEVVPVETAHRTESFGNSKILEENVSHSNSKHKNNKDFDPRHFRSLSRRATSPHPSRRVKRRASEERLKSKERERYRERHREREGERERRRPKERERKRKKR
ncbi:uncharacterized protein LOC135143685 [Zophobas morio]|uniref:uncharacterized protein LOC135143685 n=1 Tax=Zophobas morio TaxID=2755281 RepID=UPI0030835779